MFFSHLRTSLLSLTLGLRLPVALAILPLKPETLAQGPKGPEKTKRMPQGLYIRKQCISESDQVTLGSFDHIFSSLPIPLASPQPPSFASMVLETSK